MRRTVREHSFRRLSQACVETCLLEHLVLSAGQLVDASRQWYQVLRNKWCFLKPVLRGMLANSGSKERVPAEIINATKARREEEVPPGKRCEKTEETWSFSFVTGEIKRLSNSEPLQLFKKFASNPSAH